ncbi:hypothetical protein ASC65_12280 [Brevundimonas sp. Root1279]|nr:hypothetical protein ASC65_12280 [Brevundimonas sp. Root1279]
MTPHPKSPVDPTSGLIQGGLGGPEDEILEDGQEEVFSRTEVEQGRIEHETEAGGSTGPEADGRAPSAAP